MHSTDRFLAHRYGAGMANLTNSFLPMFPELDSVEFEVDLLPSSSRYLGLTDHDRRPPRVRLRPTRPTNPSLTYTIPHELTHLIQRPVGRAPMGERACDVFAMARAGNRFLVPPAYVRVPATTWRDWPRWNASASGLARQAIRLREDGIRPYIRWWENAFLALVRALSPSGVSSDIESPRPRGESPAGGL